MNNNKQSMKNNPQQNENNNAKDQFSNSQPMTFAQQTEFLKTMTNNKQNSIQYLGWELENIFCDISPELWDKVNQIFEKAIAMHKDEIKTAFIIGDLYADDYFDDHSYKDEQYYKKTFGGNNEQQ
jgi:hypothetical protein